MTPTLDALISDFVRRRRKMRATGVFCLVSAAAVAWLVGVGLVDRLLPLPGSLRLITLSLLLAVLSLAIFRIVQLLFGRRFDRLIAAKQIEAMTPELRDRLITVVTQQALPASQRGSESLTQLLADDVTHALAVRPPEKLITDRQIAPAAVLLAVVAMIAGALAVIPSLGLPRLVARQLMPLADIPPVTTTRIDVLTHDLDVPQGQPVAIVADITDGPGDATLLVGASDEALQPVAMPRTFADRFAVTLPAVERDMVYRVRSGDAVSPTFRIRVLTRPTLARLRLRMEFPDYLRREPLSVDSTNGRIEAVRGTRVTIGIQSTEPLSNATLAIEGSSYTTTPTIDAHSREASFVVESSGKWSIAMTSQRGVKGSGFDDMEIICVDDRPPIAQFVRSDLRLHPSDVAAIPFQAIDDFGVEKLRLDVESGQKRLASTQIALGTERRMIRDVATVDLAPFSLVFGDVVTITVTATDGAGQTRAGASCRILLSPRSVDPRVLRRIDALGEAVAYAEAIPKQPTESVTCLRAMMRALAASDTPELSEFLEIQIDRAQRITSAQVWGLPTLEKRETDLARELAQSLAVVYRGQQARLLQAEMENIRAAQQKKDLSKAERAALDQSVARAKSEFDVRLAQLQIRPNAGDIDIRVKTIIERERAEYRNQHRPAAEEVSRAWAEGRDQSVQQDRIAIAAQTQILRADSDLQWARDLQTIARAMSRNADEVPKGFVEAVRAVERIHRLADEKVSASDRSAADAARKQLREWAGEVRQVANADEPSSADPVSKLASMELQHQRAMAEAQEGKSAQPEQWQAPAVAREEPQSQAEAISEIAQQQARVARRTESASVETASALSNQQAQIAEALRQVEREQQEGFFDVDEAAERERMLESLRAAQRALADLPQQLASVQRQAQTLQQMRDAADQAAKDARDAAAQDRVAADRASTEASRRLDEARDQFAESIRSLASSASQSLRSSAEQLGALGTPMTNGDRELGSAIDSFQKSVSAANMPAAAQEQAKVLSAVAELQASLRIVQRQAVDRDPVIAARFFADKAAEAMRQLPPDLPAAREYQKETGDALRGAWDAAMARTVKDKLESVPAFQSVFFDDLAFDGSDATVGMLDFDRTVTPQWGRLRDKRDSNTTTAAGAFMPAGFEQQLKLYFEALDKARSDDK